MTTAPSGDRRLFLLRHATTEAARDIGDEADCARVLTAAGTAEAIAIGDRVARLVGGGALAILTSPARRTRQTATRVADALDTVGARPSIVSDAALYNADSETILARIRDAAPDADLMVVGHNPGLYHLVLTLAGDAVEERAFACLTQGYPPATLAVFATGAPWAELRPAVARLTDILRP